MWGVLSFGTEVILEIAEGPKELLVILDARNRSWVCVAPKGQTRTYKGKMWVNIT